MTFKKRNDYDYISDCGKFRIMPCFHTSSAGGSSRVSHWLAYYLGGGAEVRIFRGAFNDAKVRCRLGV